MILEPWKPQGNSILQSPNPHQHPLRPKHKPKLTVYTSNSPNPRRTLLDSFFAPLKGAQL